MKNASHNSFYFSLSIHSKRERERERERERYSFEKEGKSRLGNNKDIYNLGSFCSYVLKIFMG